MTGYGKATCEINSRNFVIEIKSLNSKQLDFAIKLPPQYKDKEMEIRNEISSKLERGKVDFTLRLDSGESDKSAKVNKSVFIEYYNQLLDVSQELSINVKADDLFQAVSKIPDVFKSEQTEIDENEWKTVITSIRSAIDELNQFRNQEGKALENDIVARIRKIENLLSEIEIQEPKRITTIKNRISQNFDEFVKNLTMDQNRFEQELIYYLEKIDITEEKVRLRNHCKYFIETLSDPSCGRKLGFITQEIGREINTIGSKANDSDIQRNVVQMKDELEKIKEQILNVL